MSKPVAKIPVVIDTAEQEGHFWHFLDDQFTTEHRKLRTGDYTVRGLEDMLTIERKTLGDAVNTVIHQWTRFRKELYRMAAMDHAIVVVEASVEDILAHRYESDAEPASVLGRLNSIIIDHGLPVVFAGNRAMAITFAERWLIQCVKKCGGVPL